VHFQPEAAFEALKWVEKIRINPGNFAETRSEKTVQFEEKSFEQGAHKVYDKFAPLVREAKKRGVCLRIGTNHGSLSDRMTYRYGNTAEGMVESALEYLRICEAESFDQVVFSMKASSPKLMIQAFRLLAYRLERKHKNYPFHLGVTEAGEGEEGRLRSAVGIGALLMDGIGDTIRVSLTEDPVNEIPVARDLISLSSAALEKPLDCDLLQENIDYYSYSRREVPPVQLGSLTIGGREKIPVGLEEPFPEFTASRDRELEWYATSRQEKYLPDRISCYQPTGEVNDPGSHDFVCLTTSQIMQAAGLSPPPSLHIMVLDVNHLKGLLPETWREGSLLWSVLPQGNVVGKYRCLAAWLKSQNRRDPIILTETSDGSHKGRLRAAAQLGSLLCDGIGDLILISSTSGTAQSLNLAYDILQAAGARRTRTEYISCPGCGRTLFDLETTTRKIKELTGHLGDVCIAVMGCIVNGPGEMADADFGYVGSTPGKVNLYAGRECVRKNLPEQEAPQALVELIKQHGRWRER
jgi:(E)-4-hydroxy-3-methylbut-2-enyl-diphosphate synthase